MSEQCTEEEESKSTFRYYTLSRHDQYEFGHISRPLPFASRVFYFTFGFVRCTTHLVLTKTLFVHCSSVPFTILESLIYDPDIFGQLALPHIINVKARFLKV